MGEIVNERQLGSDNLSPFQIELIEGEQFEKFWPGIEHMLDSVPHTWTHTTKERMFSDVVQNRMQVWGIGPSKRIILVLFTTVAEYPAQRILQVVWAGGNFDLGMLSILEATLNRYADVQNCDTIEIIGRPGWEKIFNRIGFKRTSITLGRRVNRMRAN